MEILNENELDFDLEKSWREELHPRDKSGRFSKNHSWKGIRKGSEVVAKNGTEGKVTSVTDTHYHIEKKDGKTSKVMKKNVIHKDDHTKLTKKKTTRKKTTTKKPATKKTTTKKAPAKKTDTTKAKANGGKASKVADPTKKKAPAKKTPAKKTPAKKTPAKKPKNDIRTDSQKNRNLAYDAGEKVGGARKDTWEASFKEKPSVANLKKLEKENSAVAQKLVTKANLLPKFDFEQEHKNGVELPVAIMKKLIQDRVAPKPSEDSPKAREDYVNALNKFQRHFAGIKSFDQMKNAVREFSDLAGRGKSGSEAEQKLAQYKENPNRYSFFNEDHFKEMADRGKKAKAQMDFSPLGDKFEGFFTSYKSRESTMKTVVKNTKEGWDKYLNPDTKAKNGGKPKDGNKKWERKAEAEHLRKGGKAVNVSKPEDLMKQYGIRGVEFGHWVNDSSGKYHLKRSAEAFSDLADVLGIDNKDVSLNGRLAIAFGARGKGGALAHYEPDRKVINMTKHGGAGSLAHEWGHAMDNIMYQYSKGGQASMSLGSEHPLGDEDPKLKSLYNNLMEAIRKPAPGDKGAVKTITLDSSEKPPSKYYPEMRSDVQSGMSPEDVYNKWAEKLAGKYDRYIENTKANRTGLRSPQDIEKTVKKYEGQKKRELNKIPHYIALELRHKQNGGKYGGDHYKGEIKVPTGQSEYYHRMQEGDGNKKAYLSQGAEMFARVFESYVQDKLDKNKQYNNYLVHSTRETDVTKFEAPFPKGKERKHMFKAMDNLLKHITKGKALKKALEMELRKSFNENEHPRDSKGKFSKKGNGSSVVAKLAKESTDGMDMYSSAMEDPEHMEALKEVIKNTEGSSVKDKLDKIHKMYEGGTNASEYVPANSIDPYNFELGNDEYSNDSFEVKVMGGDGLEADNGGGRAVGKQILLSSNVMNVDDKQTKDFVFHHEYGHTLTNRFNGLSKHIMNNPSGILGRVNQVKGEFEPTLDSSLRLGSAGFRATPEEVWADSYGAYRANPSELKSKNPEIYDFVDRIVSRIPDHDKDLNEAVSKFRNMDVVKSFNENEHPRDSKGKFSKVYHTTKDKDFRYDSSYHNSQQELGRGLYTATSEDVPYWHRALADKATGERHPYVVPMDVSGANIMHHSDIPAPHTGQLEEHLINHYGGDSDKALEAIEQEQKEHITGETFDDRPFEIAMKRLYAKTKGYDGIYATDGKAENQVVLFDDSKVKYEPAMGIDDFLKKQRWGEL